MSASTAIELSAVARAVGIKTEFKTLGTSNAFIKPQRIAVIGQGSSAVTYSTTKQQFSSADAVGGTYGFGSPLHLAALKIFPLKGLGVGSIPVTFYPLEDHGSGAVAAGDITPAGVPVTETRSYQVVVNNIYSEPFLVTTSDTVATIVDKMVIAVNAVKEMPIIAADGTTKLDVTAKWKGVSGNSIKLNVIGSSDEITFAFTQPAGGLNNPDVDAALNQMGNVWETLVVNCMESTDTTTLDKIKTFGDGRWSSLVKKPFVSFTGSNEVDVNTATTVPDARKTDYINAQLSSPGSDDLPFVIAAAQVAEIAKVANNNPPRDYGAREVAGLIPGADGDQWSYAERDQAVKAGVSTVEVVDGVVQIGDIVTYYHPTNESIPAYRYVVDIVRLQNIIYNLDLIFGSSEWVGAPLLPDADPTINREAKKPKMAKAEMSRLTDNLSLAAIISDPSYTKASMVAEINSTNPKRLDICYPVRLSGNTNIVSIDLKFGFYLGTSQVVA